MFSLFKKGLAKVSEGIGAVMRKLTDRPAAQTLEEMEAALLAADLGPDAAGEIVKELSNTRQGGKSPADVAKDILRRRLQGIDKPLPAALSVSAAVAAQAPLQTILIVGINGVGKTTTVAKLAAFFKARGRTPLVAAADTFRAAANEQLRHWAGKAGVPLIESRLGADPAAVAFDALKAAQARGHDTLLIDTAGRLHTKEKLMEELGKIDRVLKKLDASAPQHCWLVLDASLGLNTLQQARVFAEAVKVTGLIITKLDGSAKAGALVPLYQTLKFPIYFVGLGEALDELKEFSLEEYLSGLLG